MQRIVLISALFSSFLHAAEPCKNDERIQEFAKEGCDLIDALFAHARDTVTSKEDDPAATREEIMTAVWMKKHAEILQLRNLPSDAYFELGCDTRNKNLLIDILSEHVYKKMEQETAAIFEDENISREQARDFFEFAHTVCKLTGARGCGRKMRGIESEQFDKELRFALEDMLKRQQKKEAAQKLRDSLVFGGNRKKE